MKHRLWVGDPLLFALVCVATLLGLLLIFDAGYARSVGSGHGLLPPDFLKQLEYVGVAAVFGWLSSRLPENTYRKLGKIAGALTIILVALVLIPGLREAQNGSYRWIRWIHVQPAEFAKVTTVVYLAGIFSVHKRWPKAGAHLSSTSHYLDTVLAAKLRRMIPAVVIFLAAVLVAKEPDLGTAGVLAAVSFVMFCVGGVSTKSLLAIVLVGSLGVGIAIKEQPYRAARLENHANRWQPEYIDNLGYQTVQGEIAQASGGLIGVGLGQGRGKYLLPAPTTDFIMATVGEEFGLVGSLTVMGLILAIVLRLFVLGGYARSRFSALILFGTGTWIAVQSVTNILMANAAIPPVGIPLPFISYGGSSLVALWIALGICQTASRPPVQQNESQSQVSGDRWRDRGPRLSRT